MHDFDDLIADVETAMAENAQIYCKNSGMHFFNMPEYFYQTWFFYKFKDEYTMTAETTATEFLEWHEKHDSDAKARFKRQRFDLAIYNGSPSTAQSKQSVQAIIEYKNGWFCLQDLERAVNILSLLKLKHRTLALAGGLVTEEYVKQWWDDLPQQAKERGFYLKKYEPIDLYFESNHIKAFLIIGTKFVERAT